LRLRAAALAMQAPTHESQVSLAPFETRDARHESPTLEGALLEQANTSGIEREDRGGLDLDAQ